ncbi:IS110 family transposase [Streptomyces griseorubiginosus]|uniref:IS110 family transposase n=1 Tax=Streptomyces griseorubiginosus TaxID=67304 RepID=UPI001FE71ED4|nr:IS110 family transposase [Streptomyces griseorubiginosus]
MIDQIGRHLADRKFPAGIRGYRDLLDWVRSHGELTAVGVEGTGAYGGRTGAGSHRNRCHCHRREPPDRKTRRRKGKSDPIDAYAAATAVLCGRATGVPKVGTAWSRRCGSCGWPAAAPSEPATRQ